MSNSRVAFYTALLTWCGGGESSGSIFIFTIEGCSVHRAPCPSWHFLLHLAATGSFSLQKELAASYPVISPAFPLSPASPRAWVTSPEELLLPHAPFWPGLGQDPCFSYDLETTWDETSAPFAPPPQQFKGSLGLMAPSCSGLALGTDQDSWLRNLPGAPAHLLWLVSFHPFQP